VKMRIRRNLAIGLAGAAALVTAGGAIAATQGTGPAATSKAIVADAADRLGVSSQKLNEALVAAMGAQIDARVKAGDLTEAQAAAIKKQLASGTVPLVGFGGGPGRGFGGPGHGHGGPGHGGHVDLQAAVAYLGLTAAELRTQLESGKTLAQVATAQGKTAAGLVDALVAAETKRLDAGVAAGRLTEAQKADKLEGLSARITKTVNAVLPERGFGRHHGDRMPPPAGVPAADDAPVDAAAA
jgi:hypothetical protein